MLDCHRLLTNAAIPQDDRIEDVTTLHASRRDTFQLARAVQQIRRHLLDHKTAASQTGGVKQCRRQS